MNEEQLKEIAILAKELGFKPCTMTTRFSFDELVGIKSNTSLVTDTCYYLLLCEIQLWLITTYVTHVQILPYNKKFLISLLKEGQNGSNPNFKELFDTYPQALAEGILESLKLIKNESN